jgi:hypothetical protein
MNKNSSFLVLAKKWAEKNDLKGPQGFLRFVMFHFVEKLSETSGDFVFKGGNLLWVYIKTPRATIDLDFITLKSNSDQTIKSTLEKACEGSTEIQFTLKHYKSVIQNDKTGANVIIEYKTNEGAKNQFELDIVFEIETDVTEITSPVHSGLTILSASVENIIADKVAACIRFGAGNTRMKDFDDLWRLSQSKVTVDWPRLKIITGKRKIELKLKSEWIGPDLERVWRNHHKQYSDLPMDLKGLFHDVNKWLKRSILLS